MTKKVLISISNGESRVAIFEDDDLVEYYHDCEEEKSFVGNIYKGKVSGIVSGLQAAFVDIALDKNTFLHLQDVNAELISGLKKHKSKSKKTQRSSHSQKPSTIGEILSVGQDVMVQVSKEEIKEKGARVTTYISLPGRYMVLLPFQGGKGGISRKIESPEERSRLKEALREVKVRNLGFIVRTAGIGHDVEEMRTDAEMLVNEWKLIERKFKTASAPTLLYNDHDIIYRIIRDIFNETIDEIYIDNPTEYKRMGQLLDRFIPSLKPKLVLYHSQTKLFNKFEIEKEIQKAIRRKIWLKSGGYLIIDEAEALTAIDVNTGRFTGKKDQEKTVLKTNLEAAKLIARLLRLRDIGGIIVIDFIDMGLKENKQKLLEEFKKELKKDRSKINVSDISEFGLVEMTRKRVRQSLKSFMFTECPYCYGSGQITTNKEIWKKITGEIELSYYETPKLHKVKLTVHPQLKEYIETEASPLIKQLQNKARIKIELFTDETFHLNHYEVEKIVKQPSASRKARVAKQRKQRKQRKAGQIEFQDCAEEEQLEKIVEAEQLESAEKARKDKKDEEGEL